MLLKGIVDAAVNGGISNWKHFYADDFAQTERDKEHVIQLKEVTKFQVVQEINTKLFLCFFMVQKH